MRVRQSLAGRLYMSTIAALLVMTSAGCAAQGGEASGRSYESAEGQRSGDQRNEDQRSDLVGSAEVLGISVRADDQGLPANIKAAGHRGANGEVATEVLGVSVEAGSPVTSSAPASTLGPGVPTRNHELEPTLRSGAALFAGTTVAQFATPTSLELRYWAQSNVVVATVNHALSGGPANDWTTQALDTVALTSPAFWAPAVVDRFARAGTAWSSAGPSLLIIDEANNVEILCAAETMIGFAAQTTAVSSQDLIDRCLP